MKNKYSITSKWSTQWWQQWIGWRKHQYPTIRLCSPEKQLPKFVRQCGLTMQVREWLQWVDWDKIEDTSARQFAPRKTVSRKTYVAAFLVKIDQEKRSLAALHRLLMSHPALVWGLGFPLVEASTPYGFDVEASVPRRDQFSRVLRRLPNKLLQQLMKINDKH